MFKALIGDMFSSQAQALVNTVNCVGIMGKGVAQAFKQRYSAMFADYSERCQRKQVRLGEPYLFHDPAGLSIVNFPTKGDWRSPSRLADIESGLDHFARHCEEWGLQSVAFPPLGCGNGGLTWAEVGPLMHGKLSRLPLDIEVYAPYNTPKTQLSPEFLGAPSQMTLDGKGQKADKFNLEWVALLEVLRGLGQQRYVSPVGRVIFQKICYVMTEMGIKTGFQFGKGSCGPFAAEVKQALHEFANRNWVQEEKLGPMLALRVGQQYEKDRAKFGEVIKRHERNIAKTVDLFSRIKNTDQAEEVFTVLYACRQLKKQKANAEVAEQELYNYILAWKKTWQTDEKKQAVASAIRHLLILGWMRVQFSESLPEAM